MRVKVEEHSHIDKSFVIEIGYGEMELAVNYDDVDHATVDRMTETLVKLIRDHWPKE